MLGIALRYIGLAVVNLGVSAFRTIGRLGRGPLWRWRQERRNQARRWWLSRQGWRIGR
jgi:hypothetical protein